MRRGRSNTLSSPMSGIVQRNSTNDIFGRFSITDLCNILRASSSMEMTSIAARSRSFRTTVASSLRIRICGISG